MKNNEDIRICLDKLLENRVILEDRDPDTFRMIKRYFRELQSICNTDLNLNLVFTSHFVKIEKIPNHTESFMGIGGFNELRDYVMFACSMAFIEETGPENPFMLPELTDYLKRMMPSELDWTEYQTRKRLVRVLQEMVSLSIITVLDGGFDDFDRDEKQEALFNVTNYARYFLRMFPENLQTLSNWQQLTKINSDKSARSQVIQRLFLSPGICRTEETEYLFKYMRNQQKFLINYFENNSYYDFELTKNLGLLVSSNRRTGIKYIPDSSSGGDLLMVIGSKLRNQNFSPDEYGQLYLSFAQWQSIVSESVQENQELLSKAYREKSFELMAKEILHQTNNTGLTIQENDSLIITPIFARLNGEFITNN